MRDFTNFDMDSFTQDLNQIDWQSIIANGNNDIDYIFSSFYSKYIEDITRWREDMNFIFEWQNNILRTSAASE